VLHGILAEGAEVTTILAVLISAPLLALAVLWAWSHTIINRNPHTVPEAAARILLHLARWLSALADGLQDGIIAYRMSIREHPIESRPEDYRRSFESEPVEELAPVEEKPRRPYWWWMKRKDDA
jgi:hypothetical protein